MSAAVVPVAVVVAAVAVTGAAGASAARATHRALTRRRLSGGAAHAVSAPAWLVRLLDIAEIEVAPERVWPLVRWAAVLALSWSLVRWPWVTAFVLLAVAVAAWLHPTWQRGRELHGYDAGLIDAVEAMTAALVSGSSLHQAVEVAGRRDDLVAADLRTVARGVDHGRPLLVEVDRWAASAPGAGAALLSNALAVTTASGGSHVTALQGVSATLREREAAAREVRALGTQARLSAVVLVLTPVAFAVAAALLDPRVGAFIVATPVGWACVVSGLAMDAAAAWWMRRLTGSLA